MTDAHFVLMASLTSRRAQRVRTTAPSPRRRRDGCAAPSRAPRLRSLPACSPPRSAAGGSSSAPPPGPTSSLSLATSRSAVDQQIFHVPRRTRNIVQSDLWWPVVQYLVLHGESLALFLLQSHVGLIALLLEHVSLFLHRLCLSQHLVHRALLHASFLLLYERLQTLHLRNVNTTQHKAVQTN